MNKNFVTVNSIKYLRSQFYFQLLFSLCNIILTHNVDANDIDTSSTLDEIVVTGTRLMQPDTHSLEELDVNDSSNYSSLYSVLENSTSIQINNNGGSGSLNDIYLRGSDPNLTLVLFNGVPLNDGTNTRGGVADLSGIDPQLLSHVEIVTGAGSAVYGSHALSGVINLVSKIPDPGTQISIGMDSISGHRLRFNTATENVAILVNEQVQSGTYKGSEHKSRTFMLQGSPTMNSGLLDVFLWGNDSEASAFPDDSGGDRYSVNRELEKRDGNDYNFSLVYQLPIYSGQLNVNLSSRHKRENIDTPAVAPGLRDPQGIPSISSKNELKKHNISIYTQQNIQSNFPTINFLVGLQYQSEEGSSNSNIDFGSFIIPSNFELQRNTYSAFFETKTPLTNNIDWQIAGRYDSVGNDQVFSPSTTFTTRFPRNNKVIMSWAKGFKSPSFYALGNPLVGDPDLTNETSATTELTYQNTTTAGVMKLSLFDNRFNHLIDFDPGPPPKLVNRNKVNSQGIELAFKSKQTDKHWRWKSQYAYTDTTTDSGEVLLGRAKNRFKFTVNKKWPQHGLSWDTNILYNSSVSASSIPTGLVKLDSAIALNTHLTWQASNKVTIQTGINNLLNDPLEHTPGNIHTGRNYWFDLSLNF